MRRNLKAFNRPNFFNRFRPKWELFNSSDPLTAMEIFDVVAETDNKAVTFGPEVMETIVNNGIFLRGSWSLIMLEENIKTSYIGLYYKPYSPFFEAFNEKTLRLVEAGLTEKWANIVMKKKDFVVIDEIDPQVLTMDHLEIGFLVCLFPLVLSIVTFIGELLINSDLKALKKFFQKMFTLMLRCPRTKRSMRSCFKAALRRSGKKKGGK